MPSLSTKTMEVMLKHGKPCSRNVCNSTSRVCLVDRIYKSSNSQRDRYVVDTQTNISVRTQKAYFSYRKFSHNVNYSFHNKRVMIQR